jgi:hypothetical protein
MRIGAMIQQLIINLVINGSEAMGEQEGTVEVETRKEANRLDRYRAGYRDFP